MENNAKENNKNTLLDFFKKLQLKIEIQKKVYSLRPKLISDLNSNFTGDFDFVVQEKNFREVFDFIYDLCKELGINFILNQQAQNKKLFKFFICENDDTFLMVEFWTVIEFTDKNSASQSYNANDIFKAIESKRLSENEVFSLIFITHLFHKNKQVKSDENAFRFDYFINHLQNEKKSLETTDTFMLLNRLKNDEIALNVANAEAVKLLSSVNIKNSSTVTDKIAYFSLRARNKIVNLKKIVPIVGPDGVGKGAVSDAALSGLSQWAPFPFKMLYRIKGLYSFRLHLIPNFKNKASNQSDEEISYYIYFIAWFMIRLLKVFKPSKKILLDRYFLDYLGTPIRYLKPNQVPEKLKYYKLLMWLIPVPSNIIFLGCKSESLISRKNELEIVAVEFLQHVYCDFIIKKKPPVTLFVSTENNVDVSRQAVYGLLSKI